MNKQPDVLVLGTGIGGAALGALLAHRGLTVTLLERNPFVGGRCVSYQKEGFTIDVFVHMFGRCEKGPYGEILRRVGKPDGIRWWHASPDSRPIFFIDDEPHPYPDRSFSTREDIGQIYRAFGLGEEDIRAVFRIWDEIESMPYEKTFDLDEIPYSHWLRRFTQNKTLMAMEHQRVLLYSVVTSREASAGELIRTIQNAERDANIGYPMGGCSAIPEAFCEIVRNHGGSIELNCPVARILVEKGKAEGVLLEDGTRIRSPLVVSNMGIRETLMKYVGPELLPSEYAARVKSLTTGKLVEETPMGMIYLKLALDRPVIDAPLILRNVREGAFEGLMELMQGLAEDRPPQGYKGINSFIPVPSNMDPSLAPPGKQLVNFYGLAPVNSGNWDAWVDYHLGYLFGLYPEVRQHLMWYDFSTLNRISKYSGRLFPDIIGIVQSVGQTGKNRPDPVTPIENLYLVGADVGRDNIGTELAAESALRVAGLISC